MAADSLLILSLIRQRAAGRPVAQLAQQAGVAYSRAHCMLRDPGDHRLRNVERMLAILAPEIIDALKRALASPPGGQPAGTTEDQMAKAKKTAAKPAPKKAGKAKPAK